MPGKWLRHGAAAAWPSYYSRVPTASDRPITEEQRDQVVESAVAQLLDMTGDTGDVQPVHISDLLPTYMETVQKRMDGEAGTRNLKTGIDELDDATGGINLQDLIVVAGRPGMGKTEFALKIVDGVTAAGGGALIFSMEMAAAQIVERSLAGSGNMSVSRLRNPPRYAGRGLGALYSGHGDHERTRYLDC